MTSTLTLVKKALIRDEGYPIGFPAPCHINCSCGDTVSVPVIAGLPMTYVCANCHTEYDQRGYILHNA